ncbi:thioredoxin [Natronomonas pharaonis DSM 2160]|uniref:Thioredoxin n=1 Tax=Natronomonas pharaonis (strain ATCC 35678 / DSM 2160 / CIP 103997 / JCM 8858 / NBRC 14720 / NCIMB 2260 / Gabara) TaxID=348780 RepID=A0A1U7EV59_NATPD|nr:TlpA disulfide reductase family protein [Natronomonas pharaonis]CAI48894.1 thioredoxin [Natronomonas pharaonis DSM 2160]
MRRRDVLIGAGSLAVLGGGAAVAFDAVGSDSGTYVDPVDLETLDAPGSEAGTTTVPDPGRVTFVELFAKWCGICEDMMPALAEASAAVEGVQFVSVTNEALGTTTTREDVIEWWRDHDGAWPVAVDADLALTQRLDATGVPYAFVIDAENRVSWQHRGASDAEEIIAQIRAVQG